MSFYWSFLPFFCYTTGYNKTNKTESKMKNPSHSFRETTLCFSSCKNHKLKVKPWWVGTHKRKKRVLFVPFILSEEYFFNICVLSQCIVYWLHFQNIYIFIYQKTLYTSYIFLLVFKTVESFQCILKRKIWSYKDISQFN